MKSLLLTLTLLISFVSFGQEESYETLNDKTSILKAEFKSSFMFWEYENSGGMDNYYRTRLDFSEAKSNNKLGFYFIRRIFSILGYLPYVVVVILFLRLKRFKSSHTNYHVNKKWSKKY